jgi:hypothetical protein
MRRLLQPAAIALAVGFSEILTGANAHAQQAIALRSGESLEIGNVWWVAHCRSIMVGLPEVEVLEGPPGLTLTIREASVVPRLQDCTDKVPGAVLVATAKDISEPVQGKLVYRIKYKTKDGIRQRASTYEVSLFPANTSSTVGPNTNPSAPADK